VPVLAGRPIVLKRVDFHASWLSSTAIGLFASGLPKTGDPPGGIILRDPSGAASGVFIDTAHDFVRASLSTFSLCSPFSRQLTRNPETSLPPWTYEDRIRYLKSAARDLLTRGVVSVHDAAVTPESLDFYKTSVVRHIFLACL
jgi:predicted amidohydrolase YtcJ